MRHRVSTTELELEEWQEDIPNPVSQVPVAVPKLANRISLMNPALHASVTGVELSVVCRHIVAGLVVLVVEVEVEIVEVVVVLHTRSDVDVGAVSSSQIVQAAQVDPPSLE